MSAVFSAYPLAEAALGAADLAFGAVLFFLIAPVYVAAQVSATSHQAPPTTNDPTPKPPAPPAPPPDDPVENGTGAYAGFAHPIRGLVTPATFLGKGKSHSPIAKDNGVLKQLQNIVEKLYQRYSRTRPVRQVAPPRKRMRQESIRKYLKRLRDEAQEMYRRVEPRLRDAADHWVDHILNHGHAVQHLGHGHLPMLDI